ncbi:helix-turn-helix transcriptional regulator [Salinicoccus cyprini]|uniref:Helix-turn-helix transcriptional regulator n=1 Tax=Salinicoccus cyprini TaxID=2493691 RepID=A0A558AZK4_9STAP|nr:AraC family transcriptional regulator [Salinicoccus cyprini]TVT29715.1 helix-turn-helix transcriptional regulator [Salinicoccus cyprini]
MSEFTQWMVDWMEDHLDKKFNLNELAVHMGYSPYYCSFRFHQATGMTIRSYVKNRRLFLSAADLKEEGRIIDIAIKYGYASQEAYSRAFKNTFGVAPGEFRARDLPLQSMPGLKIVERKGTNALRNADNITSAALPEKKTDYEDSEILNVLNGQDMYDEFSRKEMMGKSGYIPFNEAMCVNPTSTPLFDDHFIHLRASGHGVSTGDYHDKVVSHIRRIDLDKYKLIVLWFGEDMFCQMNMLTMLAYLEQIGFEGIVHHNSFRDDEFKVAQYEVFLGSYYSIYRSLLVNQEFPKKALTPVMYQSARLYMEMSQADNRITDYISRNNYLADDELVRLLMHRFQTLGYGDLQYFKLIDEYRRQHST